MPKRTDAAHHLALTAARVVEETRGSDIVVLDLRKLTDVFDYFVIASGSSRRQMHAMADEVKQTVRRELADEPRGVQGYDDSHWIVMDYGDVVVHLFDIESRAYWDLENLWADANRVAHLATGATAG